MCKNDAPAVQTTKYQPINPVKKTNDTESEHPDSVHPASYNPHLNCASKRLQPLPPCLEPWPVLLPAASCCVLRSVPCCLMPPRLVVALDLLQQPQEVQEQIDNVLQAHKCGTKHEMTQRAMQVMSGSPTA
jgi:hypothetical protein